MSLTPSEIKHYSQQLKLDEIGIEGQLKLRDARVLCIGAGGLGSSLLLYLAAAGIGTIGIVDDDVVEITNLHRQILYQATHVGLHKAEIAKLHLSSLNPHIELHAHTERFTIANAHHLINHYDIIADCSDNFATHYLINDVCYDLDKPAVFASVSQFEGQCSLFLGKKTPCLRCIFPVKPALDVINDCATGGVLGVVPGLLGVIQATEVIKTLLGIDTTLSACLLMFDLLNMQVRRFATSRNPECVLCVLNTPLELLTRALPSISLIELNQKIQRDDNLFLLDVRTQQEHAVYNIGGVVIPLPELLSRLTELKPHDEIVVYCQSGERSSRAVEILIAANFKNVRYLRDAIDKS